uniref:Uncharacterized protein n=1 Tax=Streptomyces sp. HK1 TaxID=405041 RepID=B0LU64_9ACTN|nr:hypothetical protein pSHK1.76 [Streptomyces sp. HK1]
MFRTWGSPRPVAPCRPRTRGDVPKQAAGVPWRQRSAPHPRGCSRFFLGRPADSAVGPAPAGMLRSMTRVLFSHRGRPRTRGDAPETSTVPSGSSVSAPHPRGCSGRGRYPAAAAAVGPAPAGMLRWR